jgi:hypothetical protein
MTRAECLAERWFQKQAGSLTAVEGEEVLAVRVDGADVQDHLREFLMDFITRGQRIHKIVDKAVKTVEGYYPPDKFDPRSLRAVFMKEMEYRWGRDKMLPMLADLVLFGKYIY